MSNIKVTTNSEKGLWQYATLSPDYTYCVLRNDAGSVRVYDVSKTTPQCVLKMESDNEKGTVTGAVLYGLQLYFTRKDSNIIYERTVSCQSEKPYMKLESCESVELVDVLRGSSNFILKTNGSKQYGNALVVYERESNSILYKLPLQNDFKDCVRREGTSDCYIIASDSRSCAVYEDDLDRLYIDAGKFDYNTAELTAYIGAASIEDWDDFKIYPTNSGEMNWPLVNWNRYIPMTHGFSRYGNYLISTKQKEFIFISESDGTGNIYRVLDMSLFKGNNMPGIFFDEKDDSLVLVTDKSLSKYKVPRIPKEALSEFNELYGSIQYRSVYGDEEKRSRLQNLFYKLVFAYGQPNKVYEVFV